MILEALISFCTSIICTAVSLCGVITLPSNVISTLQAVTCYGSYVVGSDLLLIFCTTVTFWLTAKITVGLVLFIWRLLPFT
jgi:hypothetical protein